MTTQTAKTNAYAVLTPPGPVNIAKTVAYAVLSTEARVGVSKTVAYAVLAESAASSARPQLFVIT